MSRMETPAEARAIIMRVAAEAESILNSISPAGTLCVAGGTYDHYRYGPDDRSQFAILRGDTHGSMWETVLRIATRRVQRELAGESENA